jgi:hypothetical protein
MVFPLLKKLSLLLTQILVFSNYWQVCVRSLSSAVIIITAKRFTMGYEHFVTGGTSALLTVRFVSQDLLHLK